MAQTLAARAGAKHASPLQTVHDRLLEAYGPQSWWPGDSPLEVIAGAILTQQTAWANVEKALANLRAAGVLSPEGLRATGEAELATLIRPSGFYRGKARKLKAFVALLDERFGGDLERMLAARGTSSARRCWRRTASGRRPRTRFCFTRRAGRTS